ncbi:MAG: O-antigen ligase family protein [Candidatus Pacebacteria bacterium]|nr:O-antigen ligase family protein [Candidatus Paceibacterota bacterium]MDD5356547.1 O-antigen ligase family protein [Candidatus Paceibacterota bacterium]
METNKILHRSILVGIFALLLIPFLVFNSMFFPFITGKNFVFRIIVEIIFGLWLILIFRDRRFLPKRSALFYAFLAFIVAITLADFLGVNPYRSFWSNFERMEGLITHLHLFALFLVGSSVLNTKKLWTRFFNSALVVSMAMALYGFLQLFGALEIHQSSSRVDGPIGNSAYMAIYMIFHVFLALFLLLRSRERRMQIIYAGVALLNTVIVYYTATRGSIIGLIGGFFLIAILVGIFERERKTLRKISIIASVGVVAIVLLFFAAKNTSFVKNSSVLNRFATISLTEQTTESRFLIWKMAYQGFKEHPIFGWGQENFILVFQKYYDAKMWNQEPWFDRTHNVVLDWLIAGGALAFLAYLSLFVVSLFCIWKKRGLFSATDKAVFTGLLAAYFCHNLFVFDNLTSYLLFIFVLSYFHFVSIENGIADASEKEFPKKISNEPSQSVQSILIPVVIIVLPIAIYFLNIPQILSNTSLINALQWQRVDPAKSLDYFKQSLSYDTLGKPEIRTQLVQSASSVAASSASDELKKNYIVFAKDEMEKQIEEEPLDARYPFFLGQFLTRFSAIDEARKNIEKALALSPKRQDMLSAIAITYFDTDLKDKGLETMKQAFDIEPENDSIRTLYAVFAVFAQRDDLVKELLLPRYHTYLVPDNKLVGAYVRTGQLKKYIDLNTVFLQQELKTGLLSQAEKDAISALNAEFEKKLDVYKKANQ